jgi:hypothetical protein
MSLTGHHSEQRHLDVSLLSVEINVSSKTLFCGGYSFLPRWARIWRLVERQQRGITTRGGLVELASTSLGCGACRE